MRLFFEAVANESGQYRAGAYLDEGVDAAVCHSLDEVNEAYWSADLAGQPRFARRGFGFVDGGRLSGPAGKLCLLEWQCFEEACKGLGAGRYNG